MRTFNLMLITPNGEMSFSKHGSVGEVLDYLNKYEKRVFSFTVTAEAMAEEGEVFNESK